MFGTSAYIMFTMDKLISTITRQLQSFVSDEASVNAVSLFHKYCAHRAQAGDDQKHGLQVDESYEMASEKVITNQNCFKMFFLYLANPTVTVELIDTDTDLDESGEENNKSVSLFKWKEYVEKYAGDEENTNETIIPSNLFLVRNVLPRKLKTEAAFDYFTSPPPDPMDFFVNEGLRAVLSSENVKLLYVQGTSDIMIRKKAPGATKQAQISTTERRSRRFREWIRKKYDNEPEAQIQD
ncbi:paired amphipathic helix protein Sin3a [Ditylenchus destructor]|nr:paired amphipathic helix protein Sin3a [Ditylenchus destructor]